MDEYLLNEVLDKLYTLSVLEKNNLYHQLVSIIKNTSNPQEAATTILAQFYLLLADKRDQTIEKTEDKVAGKVSPIFRRIG